MLVKWKKTEEILDEALSSFDIAQNLSRDGICLPMDKELRAGEKLFLEIRLPSRQIVKIKAQVIYVNDFTAAQDLKRRKKYDIGIEFLEMGKEDRNEFNKFLFSLNEEK